MEEWVCPSCGTSNDDERDKCIYCGRLRPPPPKAPVTYRVSSTADGPKAGPMAKVAIFSAIVLILLVAGGLWSDRHKTSAEEKLQPVNGIYEIDGYYFVNVSEEDPDRVGEVSRMLALSGTMELTEGEIDAHRFIAPIEGCVYFQVPVWIFWLEEGSGYDRTSWCAVFEDGEDESVYWSPNAYEYTDAESFSPMILDGRNQFTFTLSAFTVAPMVNGKPTLDGYNGYHMAVSLGDSVVGFETREAAEQFHESLTDLDFWDKWMNGRL